MNQEADSDLLRYWETVDEIKKESIESKEEPFDGMADIKQEDLFYHSSDEVKNKISEINEDYQFYDVKQEESILDDFNATENGSVVKEEPINGFVDIKEEYLFTLPVADVFCPSTGVSRPLSIDLYKRQHSRNLIAPPRPTIIKNKTKCKFCDSFYNMGTGMESHVRSKHPEALESMKCDFCDFRHTIAAKMNLHLQSIHPEEFEKIMQQKMRKKCDYCDSFFKMGAGMTQHVQSMHYRESEWLLKKCAFCDSAYKMGTEMENHVRSMHPEECTFLLLKMNLTKCDFCDGFYKKGAGIEIHRRVKHPEELKRCIIVSNPV